MTDSAREHALSLLSMAQSHEAYVAAVKKLQLEVNTMKGAVASERESILRRYGIKPLADVQGGTPAAPAEGGRRFSPDEAAQLRQGTTFVGEDGRTRTVR
jgi:hypothetical protein